MAEPVDLPARIAVSERAGGAQRSIDAYFAEHARVVSVVHGAKRVRVVGDTAAGDGRDGQPVGCDDRPLQSVVGIEPVAPQPGPAERRIFAQHRDAGVKSFIEAAADRQGQKVEADLGQTFLHPLKGIRLQARKARNKEVAPGIDRLNKGIRLLHGKESRWEDKG